MKKILLSMLVLVVTLSVFAQTSNIVVKITGIESNEGLIQIGLYNNEASFPVYDKVYKGVFPKANKLGITYTFKNIPEGTYAVAVYHDKNSDKELNKNLFGAPKENYGFSNNKFGTFGPPDFNEVSFKVKAGKNSNLSIKLE